MMDLVLGAEKLVEEMDQELENFAVRMKRFH